MSGSETRRAPVRGPEADPAWVFREHRGERRLKLITFLMAVTIHLLVLSVRLPESRPVTPAPEHRPGIVVRRYVPPPPPMEPMRQVRKKSERRIPIPDPTPADPEPIREPAAPVPPDVALEGAIELSLGTPEGPPVSRIALAGEGGVTLPVLIPETKVAPDYPEAARIARTSGSVILQAVIQKDGTVGDLRLLRANPPSVGFEEAAVAAVRQWRYRPATAGGRPVDAYFTVFVSFDLL